MLFSLEWLRELCPVGEDVARVAAALTSRGLTVDSVTADDGDHVLDVDVPANRPDCLGHVGLARELAAAFGIPLAPAPAAPSFAGEGLEQSLDLLLAEPVACPRYTAGLVRDVRVGPSPDWVVRRLARCGLRSINNVVDASSLVLLERGHPVHFFDFDRLTAPSGGARARIEVRRALPGERLQTLDGADRVLDGEVLVIADGRRAVALAGILGGRDSEIVETTQNVLIEAAWFAPATVRGGARRLGLATDASYRFARGVDPEGVLPAQWLSMRLLSELGRGRPAPGPLDVRVAPEDPCELTLRVEQLRRLLGFELEGPAVLRALAALQLAPAEVAPGRIRVTVPSWRVDIEREADVVEEVARHVGYDRIPATSPAPAGAPEGTDGLDERVRDALAHQGFHEAVGYAMIGAGEDDPYVPADAPPALRLSNPIAEPLAVLRRSILPGLVRAADLNLRRGNRDVRLFEAGRVFLPRPATALPLEQQRVGLVWSGAARPHHFTAPSRSVDLFDMFGLVERLLDSVRPNAALTRRAGHGVAAFHPALAAEWSRGTGPALAWAGRLHPRLEEELGQEVFLAEIDLDAVAALPAVPARYAPLPRVPAVTRDLSLVLGGARTYADVLQTLVAVEAPAPTEFQAIDRYQGPPLGDGETALTVRVTLQPHERTLTDTEIESYRLRLVDALASALGTHLRT